jgi:hypothetical protein
VPRLDGIPNSYVRYRTSSEDLGKVTIITEAKGIG